MVESEDGSEAMFDVCFLNNRAVVTYDGLSRPLNYIFLCSFSIIRYIACFSNWSTRR